MRILWVNPNFLHPTTKGGQIRTLKMLEQLHQRHEIHYAAFAAPGETEGVERSAEYSARSFPFPLNPTSKRSPAFALDLAAGLLSSTPLAISRYRTRALAGFVEQALAEKRYDRVVCDFLAAAANFPSLRGVALFQHNVETMIWRRRVEQAGSALERWYLRGQAERMFAYEGKACRDAGLVIAVSEEDAVAVAELFAPPTPPGWVPTGVDVESFQPPAEPSEEPPIDLAFVGSMDWAPNEDAMRYFIGEILPLIRRERPACSLAIVGRSPSAAMRALGESVPGIEVTGTVPDVRPYLWRSRVSVVPLRIGGGTRLKIYEAAAAGSPVVSTSIGAEGLAMRHEHDILLADDAAAFARACLRLLDDSALHARIRKTAMEGTAASRSWSAAACRFEDLLLQMPGPDDTTGRTNQRR